MIFVVTYVVSRVCACVPLSLCPFLTLDHTLTRAPIHHRCPPPPSHRYVSAGSGDHCCSNEGYCCPKDNCFYTSNNRICGVRYKCCIAGEVLSEGDGATESDDVRHYPTGIYLTLQYPRWAGVSSRSVPSNRFLSRVPSTAAIADNCAKPRYMTHHVTGNPPW